MMRSTNRPTAVATRQFFEFLETKYGGLPLFRLPRENGALPPKVAKRSRLELKDLQDLLTHKHLALHITNFYPHESAIKLGLQIAESVAANKNKTDSPLHNWKVSTAKGLESSDVFTMGKHQPWNMAISSPNMVEEYLMQVPLEFRHRRRHDSDNNIAKVLWPLDQLRLELDEIWPAGSNLSRSKSGKCMGGGLPRIMMGPTRWKKGLIHVDELGPLKLEEGCFSANIYLQLPSDDANDPVMEIWPLDVRSRWDWYRVSLCCTRSLIALHHWTNMFVASILRMLIRCPS